ncbi:AAA family ATPase [Streptomyces sp. NPDC006743]|uniref:AAA family ATPase n=1 Tax=Streptomyces sp. NPDC006743 TaxID=3154480 RepID=UPI0034554F62
MNAQVEISPRTAGTEGRQAPLPVPAPPGTLPGEAGLVGRDRELRALGTFLRQALENGAARVLRGHAGAGKSALLDACVERAAATGMRVLRCTGIRGGNPSDLSGLLQIVWPVLASPGWSSAAGRLRALEMLLLDGAASHQGNRSQLPFAVLRVLESVSADQPLLMAVDDWDALDRPSREVLSFVARRTEGHAMGFLLAARPHRTRLTALAGLPELPIGPLTPAQSAALLVSRRPGNDAQAVRELLATAAGNPLALLELPTRSEDDFPYVPASSDRLASAMAPGVSRLPSGTRDLLLVAALHPAGELPLLLSAASRIAGTELDFATAEPAERDGLVVFDGMRLRFSHPATAGAVVHDVAPSRCRAAHAALAAVLTPDSVGMLWHLSQAAEGPDPELARRLEAAHRHALEQCEPPMAVRLLRRAADLHRTPEERGRCTLRAAQLAHDLGLQRAARTLAHRALRHPLGPLGTLCAQALTWPGGGTVRLPAGSGSWPAPAAAAEQESALELIRLTAPAVAGDPERAEELLAFMDTLPERADDPRLLHALATVAPVCRAATVVSRLAAFQGLTDTSVRDLERLGEAALLAGDPLRALDLHRRAERRYRFHELPEPPARVILRQGLAHLAVGDWGQGGQAFEQSERLAEEYGLRHHRAAARLLGELTRGLRTGTVPRPDARGLEEARRSVPGIDEVLAVGSGWAQVEGGDFGAGFAALASLVAAPGRRTAALSALVPFAEAAVAANAAGQARAVLDQLARDLGAQCAPLVTARLAVARAVLADDRDAEPLYEQAFAMDAARLPFLEAPLRLAHGRRLRLRRQFAESRVGLRQAAALYTMMGADARAARIAAELRASGERQEGSAPGAQRRTPVRELLNAQELRIAELAARGLSNRQIGELLHLSPRTIGAYLYRIFPRLGVTARAQLAEVLRDGLAG